MVLNSTIDSAREEFKQFLKKENHRITPERFEVLNHAIKYSGHFGADELFIKMKGSKSNVSRATVYNTLELLAACDLLTKRNFGETKSWYESNYNRKNHDHLICLTCGEIKEFSEPKVEKLVEEITSKLGFDAQNYSFNIYGCCKNKNCKLKDVK